MTEKEKIKYREGLNILAGKHESNYALESHGYKTALLDVLDIINKLPIHDVRRSYFDLQNGDLIEKNDEYLSKDNKWLPTESVGEPFNQMYFRQHRRPNYA